jgi:hypothetical protein
MIKRNRIATPERVAGGERIAADPVRFVAAPPASPRGRMLYETLDIRIDRDGVWYYHGEPIRRKELVCLFASALTRDENGGYWLVTPTEMGPVSVDDVPFIAVELFVAGCARDQVISFRTNIDQVVTVDHEHELYVVADAASGERVPYLRLGLGLDARLARSVYYDLVGHGSEYEHAGQRLFGVWSRGSFFPLGELDPDQ